MERIIYNTSGLKYDNQTCDWVDKTIPYTEWLSWIDKPCPKCQSNLLTESDYLNAITIFALVDDINKLSDEDFNQLYETNKELFTIMESFNMTSLEVDCHNGVTVKPKS